MRAIVRKERPTPAPSCTSPTSTATASPALRPAPAVGSSPTWNCATAAGPAARNRIRAAKDTSLRNMPLHEFAANQIWCEIVALACDLLAWMQMLALTGPARRWGTQATAAAPCRQLAMGPQITTAISRLHAFAPG
jgi:Transposase DDE domain group 1